MYTDINRSIMLKLAAMWKTMPRNSSWGVILKK